MKEFGQFFIRIMLIVIVSTIIISCKKKVNNRSDLIAYINNADNGLIKTNQIGKIKAELHFKPWQLMSLSNNDKNGVKGNKYPIENFSGKFFFVLSLSANNKELLKQLPLRQYSEMVSVMAFRMNEFVEIVPDGNKPVDPVECIFEQTYGMGIANNLLLVFDNKELIGTNNLSVKIKEFGLDTGDLNFSIKTKDIIKLQNIALN